MMLKEEKILHDGIQYVKGKEGLLLEKADDTEEIRIPDEIDGEPVRWAAPYAFSRTHVRQIKLSRHMEKIGNYAFYRCFQLRKLTFSDSLCDVGAGAFNGCGLRELEVDFYQGEKSVLKFVTDELRYALYVTMQYHRGNGERQTALLLFPEHYEEAVENTPARIVETHYHGSGGDYRQCFYEKELNYNEYDRLFPRAIAEEETEITVQLASLRLYTPYKLSKNAKDSYETFLREHMSCAGRTYVERKDIPMLRFFGKEGYWDQNGLDEAIDLAAAQGQTEMLGLLLDTRRSLFPKKKKVFEL